LIASINQLQKDYGVTPDVSVPLAPQVARPPRMHASASMQR
jgi:hypothetical protein